MEGRKDEALQVAELNAEGGLPVTFDEVHLDVNSPSQKLDAVLDLAMGPLTAFVRGNIAVDVTREGVVEAMKEMNAFGNDFLGKRGLPKMNF